MSACDRTDSRAQPADTAASIIVAYVTDIEGNWDLWTRTVALSSVLEFALDGPPLVADAYALRFKTADGMLVYGGDVFDKGPGDLRIATQLVALKRAHPERVFLIIGNRDMNKARLSAELDDADIARPLDEIPGPYWFPEEGSSPAAFVRARAVAELGEAACDPHRLAAAMAAHNTAAARLEYMLRFTMGAPDTFEHRREELAVLRGCGRDAVSDAAVVDSFRGSVAPGGVVYEYLALGQLAAIVGDTLFVHGGLSERSLGFVPDFATNRDAPQAEPPGRDFVSDSEPDDRSLVHRWVAALNEYARAGVAEWQAEPQWDASRQRRGGQSLFAYFYAASVRGRSVAVGSFAERGGPQPPPEHVCALLLRCGISRVLAGHKPFSDMPLAMRSPSGLEVIIADTSYADPTAANPRAVAVHEVLLEGPAAGPLSARVHGFTAAGEPYSFTIEPPIGDRTDDGWWVQAPDLGRGVRHTRGDGRNVQQRFVPRVDTE